MDPTVLKPWLDMLVNYGVTLFITIGVFWFVWKYATRWVESTIAAQEKVPLELAKLNHTMSEGLANIQNFGEDMHQIKLAVRHGAAAGEAATAGNTTDVVHELRKMRESVENGGEK